MAESTDAYDIIQATIVKLKKKIEKADEGDDLHRDILDLLMDCELSHLHHGRKRLSADVEIKEQQQQLDRDLKEILTAIKPLVKDYNDRKVWSYSKATRLIKEVACILLISSSIAYGLMKTYFVEQIKYDADREKDRISESRSQE